MRSHLASKIPERLFTTALTAAENCWSGKSVRGPGGYLLAKPPEQISMSEVLRVLEGAPDEMTCRYAKAGKRAMCSLCRLRHATSVGECYPRAR